MGKSYIPLTAKIPGVNDNHNLSPSEASVLSAFPSSAVGSHVSQTQNQLGVVASFAAVACGDVLVDVIHLPFGPLENDRDACYGNKGDVSFDSSTPVQTVLAVDALAASVQVLLPLVEKPVVFAALLVFVPFPQLVVAQEFLAFLAFLASEVKVL